jgi:nicotinamide phosphoribosyltransferase
MRRINPLLLADFYKTGHIYQYPEGTEMVYSNWTPRGSRIEGINEVVVFGLQYFIKEYLINQFNEGFFDLPKEQVVGEYKRILDNSLGPDVVKMDHIEALHDLGYLPLEIKAMEEGTKCPMRIPCITIKNTLPEFFWVTNYIESIMSCIIWSPMTTATIAAKYREILDGYAEKTSDIPEFVDWQGHDFSFRGMGGLELASMSGHLTSFTGTDTIPAIPFMEEYYGANCDKELVGGSVGATEHSVVSLNGDNDEFGLFKRLITKVYPSGIISLVSDTWDLWKVLTDYLPKLKNEVMARDGKVVIRPDSGDPVDIICGKVFTQCDKYLTSTNDIKSYYTDVAWDFFVENCDDDSYCDEYNDTCKIGSEIYRVVVIAEIGKMHDMNDNDHYVVDGIKSVSYERLEVRPEDLGVIELLWNTFGGEVNSKGFKQLDTHIGAIYGDAITMKRCEEICKRLESKGFTSTNVVLGIGSFSYNFLTRDSLGFAMKATYGVVNGEARNIFKDPVTDDGLKKSAKGLLMVDENFKLHEEVTPEVEKTGILKTVFKDGKLLKDFTLQEIRDNVRRL